MVSLDLIDIEKCFGKVEVLKRISLDVRAGEFMTLVGPSGCGKSTLLRIIAGLEIQDGGDLRIDGRSVSGLRPKLRDTAMVFQSYALYPHMTAYENMALPLTMQRMTMGERLPFVGRLLPGSRHKRESIAADVLEVARVLDLTALLDRRPIALSGGQRQRVALGRAMVRHPSIFLMDEPLSNLDAKLRVKMRTELGRLHHRLKATFVYVTHDQIEAMTMSSRVAVMMDGEILQVDTPARIYEAPDNLKVAEFIGSPKINVLEGQARADGNIDLPGCVLVHDGGAISGIAEGDPVSVGVRPEAWELVDAGTTVSASEADHTTISGRVVTVELTGSEVFLQVEAQGCRELVTVREAPHQVESIAVDSTMRLRPRSGQFLLFGPDGQRIWPAKGVVSAPGVSEVA